MPIPEVSEFQPSPQTATEHTTRKIAGGVREKLRSDSDIEPIAQNERGYSGAPGHRFKMPTLKELLFRESKSERPCLSITPHFGDALLVETKPGTYSVSFRKVQYQPTNNLTALGVLLLGLQHIGIKFGCLGDHSLAMHLMQHALYIMQVHSNDYPHMPVGSRPVPLADRHKWAELAANLAPNAGAAVFVRECIDQALGPYTNLSGEEFCSGGPT